MDSPLDVVSRMTSPSLMSIDSARLVLISTQVCQVAVVIGSGVPWSHGRWAPLPSVMPMDGYGTRAKAPEPVIGSSGVPSSCEGRGPGRSTWLLCPTSRRAEGAPFQKERKSLALTEPLPRWKSSRAPDSSTSLNLSPSRPRSISMVWATPMSASAKLRVPRWTPRPSKKGRTTGCRSPTAW